MFRMYAVSFYGRWESRWMLYGCLSNRTAYNPPPVLMSQNLPLYTSDPTYAKYLTDGKRTPKNGEPNWIANSPQPWIAVDFLAPRYIEFALVIGYNVNHGTVAR
uniref:F5/8 type C domain-containing protein n=1 Tax=Macrostomum lignano TaxID=282301 RepID=A0A1I8GCQ4_9PLAT